MTDTFPRAKFSDILSYGGMGPRNAAYVAELNVRINELEAALSMLLTDVEGSVDYGMPFDNPEHGFYESVMAARKALKP